MTVLYVMTVIYYDTDVYHMV